MLGWAARLGSRGALVVGMCGLAACYKVPEPDCGFVCGPSGACPEDYTCATDNRCHRDGTPASLVCATDAGLDAAGADARADADLAPPTVTATVPANNATSVDVATTIVVTFSEPVTHVDPTNFSVSQGATPITGAISTSGGGTIYTFTPSGPLPSASTISVTLSSGINDVAGNPLAPLTFTFTTV